MPIGSGVAWRSAGVPRLHEQASRADRRSDDAKGARIDARMTWHQAFGALRAHQCPDTCIRRAPGRLVSMRGPPPGGPRLALAGAFAKLRTTVQAGVVNLQQQHQRLVEQQQQQRQQQQQQQQESPPAEPREDVDELLTAPECDLPRLRAAVTAHGVGDDPPGRRLLVWQLLLGVLPRQADARPGALRRLRESYAALAAELTAPPQARPAPEDDHPLSVAPQSAWASHFRYTEVKEQILRDVERTQRELCFFSRGGRAVMDAQCRSLFVYAATNSGVAYVQGMNELMAVFLYACSSSSDGGDTGSSSSLVCAEGDAFQLFVAFVAELRDMFCSSLDTTSAGVAGTLARLGACIAAADPELGAHMAAQGLNYQFFAFRWITTALSQEFSLPDVLRIWDYLFAAHHGPLDALLRVCAAMVLRLRHALLAQDFAANMKMLQSYPHDAPPGAPSDAACTDDVAWILRRAQQLPSPVPEGGAAEDTTDWEPPPAGGRRSPQQQVHQQRRDAGEATELDSLGDGRLARDVM